MCNKRYSPGSAAFFSAGSEIYIVYNFSTGHSSVIARKDAHKYSQLSGIKLDENHLENLLSLKDPDWEIKKYEKLLSLLKKEKLLIPLPDIQNEEKQKNCSGYEIAIITCERPQLLGKSFESIAERVMQNNPEISVTLFDDSVNDESKIKNRRLTSEIENKYGIKTSYIGEKEKYDFIETFLAGSEKEVFSRELMNFALFGDQRFSCMKGPGSNRNASLLLLSGRKIISFDDDVKYLFGSPPEFNNDIEISYIKNPDKNIFPNMKKVINNFKYAEIDALNYIDEVLGKTVKTLIKKAENSHGSIISNDFIPEPGYSLNDDESTVKAAVFGLYGGRWYSSPLGIYFDNGKGRKKAFKNISEYNSIKKNPFHLMLPNCLTLSRAPSFIATATGMDATAILPPYPPYGRNSDGIWATVMLAVNRKSFIAQLPLAIYHEISNKNPFTDKDYEDTSASFGIITVLIIKYLRKTLISFFPEITYEILGKQLIYLSQLNNNIFISFCHDLWLEYTGSLIEQLERRLFKYKGKPRHWKKDTEKYFVLLENQSLNPENALPKELREHYSTEETIWLYKKFFKDYGELIKSWPFIWKEACKRNIKEESKGVR